MLFQKAREVGEIIRSAAFGVNEQRGREGGILRGSRFTPNRYERFLKDPGAENLLRRRICRKLQSRFRWINVRRGAVYLHWGLSQHHKGEGKEGDDQESFHCGVHNNKKWAIGLAERSKQKRAPEVEFRYIGGSWLISWIAPSRHSGVEYLLIAENGREVTDKEKRPSVSKAGMAICVSFRGRFWTLFPLLRRCATPFGHEIVRAVGRGSMA